MNLDKIVKASGKAKSFLLDAIVLDHNKALEAVKKDGNTLKYVHKQTEAICLAAVKQNGYALQHVREQTEAICLAAVRQNGHALQFVDFTLCI